MQVFEIEHASIEKYELNNRVIRIFLAHEQPYDVHVKNLNGETVMQMDMQSQAFSHYGWNPRLRHAAAGLFTRLRRRSHYADHRAAFRHQRPERQREFASGLAEAPVAL
jgi:hypothetical protein